MLGVGFLMVFGIVVTTYPSYANNDVVVFAVVAGPELAPVLTGPSAETLPGTATQWVCRNTPQVR